MRNPVARWLTGCADHGNDWLPQNYKTKRVGAFGKAEFLTLIESSIEYRKSQIIGFFDEFDSRIKKRLSKWDLTEDQVKAAFLRDVGNGIGDIHYGHSVELNQALGGNTNLFDSDYFSAMLEVMKKFPNDKPMRSSSIEQGFGWAKTVGHMRQVLVRGLEKVDQMFVLTMTAYNLTRLRTLGQVRLQGAR